MDDTDAVQHFIETYNQYVDTLPHPEDMWGADEIKFVGFYLMLTEVYRRFSAATTYATQRGYVSPYLVEREAAIEQWLNSARDYLPEWVNSAILELL